MHTEEKETGRLEAFSDGVFAIAMTLLALDLKVPHQGDRASASELALWLAQHGPSYLAFTTSFGTALVMWVHHHGMFRLIRKVTSGFLFANGFLLLLVTVVPFPTALISAYFGKPGSAVASAVYAGTFVAISIAFNLLWRGGAPERGGVGREPAAAGFVAGTSRCTPGGPPPFVCAG